MLLFLFLNIRSMRCETAKPPKMLILAKTTAIRPRILGVFISAMPAVISAPTITMPEMALETLINGECSAGVTPQTTK